MNSVSIEGILDKTLTEPRVLLSNTYELSEFPLLWSQNLGSWTCQKAILYFTMGQKHCTGTAVDTKGLLIPRALSSKGGFD